MSIESEITRINNNIAATYTALSAKGATMPATENSANLASTVATVPSGGDPVNKAFEIVDGVLDKPKNITFSENNFAGATSIGQYGLYMKYDYTSNNVSNPGGVVKFDSVTSIGAYGLQNAFGYCNITSVSFNSLTQINNDYSLAYSFSNNKNLTSISFPSLISATGTYALTYCFNKCTSLTSVSFQELDTATGSSFFNNCFNKCTSLTSVYFQKLKTIGNHSCDYMFYSCTSLSSVDFSALTSIGIYGLTYAFFGCSSLTTISFPSLTTVESNSFIDCFKNCKNLTEIHFPAAIQATIEGLSGYSSKWGASNATIYFDL